jgi:hypothetical protein
MKGFGGEEVQFHAFLTSTLNRSEWSASRPGRFTTGDRAGSLEMAVTAMKEHGIVTQKTTSSISVALKT